ncbi:MAG: NADH-quinone oxidoreductase subunit L [Bradymonadaceae bacterium]|nr:NADH-quinone oxidoreductase subunit L [Lujinxingiaceae bacterium]
MEPLFSNNFHYLGLIVLMPLLGAIINGLLGAKLPSKVVNVVACAPMLLSFVFTLIGVRALLAQGVESEGGRFSMGYLSYTVYEWIYSGSLSADISFMLDPLSATLVLIITGVGFLIHVYSTGYMAQDPSKWRYFSYLNLFVFAMLLLVLGKNLLVTFIGWEGVGVCSYLLIGFWYTDSEKAAAGMKAFVVNRVGDFAFLLGMFILFFTTGTIDYVELSELATNASTVPLLIQIALPVGLLILIGCTGKSAQIPLFVWLPDAMAGPTPVSALIHAATMVTAGVFVICRLNWLFTLDPRLMLTVAVIGCLTAFFAATIAIVQTDIKRVLAYSTISQLGFMFMAVGVGAYTAAIFHVATHAFFKALLFLGAGSVIHGMHHEQDIRKMGGLKKYMPITRWTFLIGCLAIAGVPFLSGFYSKDMILWSALSNVHFLNIEGVMAADVVMAYFTSTVNPFFNAEGVEIVTWAKIVHGGLFGLGLLTALLTAFYMFRLYFMTFEGECRADAETKKHIHESPDSMLIPLIVLAFLSVVAGYIGWPHVVVAFMPEALQSPALLIEHWLDDVFYHSKTFRLTGRFGDHPYGLEALAIAGSVGAAAVGIGTAWFLYIKRPELPAWIAERARLAFKWLENKYYIDELYDRIAVQPTLLLGQLSYWFDRYIIDGLLVNGTGFVAESAGKILRHMQSGNVQRYATYITLALVFILFALIYPACF